MFPCCADLQTEVSLLGPGPVLGPTWMIGFQIRLYHVQERNPARVRGLVHPGPVLY